MSRQLTDLQRMTQNEVSDADLLLIRDVSSQTDKSIKLDDIVGFVLKDGSIVTSKIADNAITTDKIKNGAVSSDKIKNGAVSSDKIKNGAVSSDKIDWATMKYGIVSDPASTTVPANGKTRIAQITLPKGKYALIASASYWSNTAARRGLYISFESSTGGTVNSMLNGLYGTATSGDTLEATNTALVNITANQATISVYANSLDFSGTFHQWGAPSVLYFRVG
ncbi:MAG: hypothetical protein ACI4TD_10980 [Phocaeicola sp.]